MKENPDGDVRDEEELKSLQRHGAVPGRGTSDDLVDGETVDLPEKEKEDDLPEKEPGI